MAGWPFIWWCWYNLAFPCGPRLFNALCVIGFTVPVLGFVQGRRPGVAKLFGLGVVLAMACLVRGIGIYVLVFIAPAYIAWLVATRDGIVPVIRRAIMLALPLLVVIGGVMGWNAWRTGYAFYTTGSQYVLIQPLAKIEARGTPVFDGDSPISKPMHTVKLRR